jgi:shikimate kinase
MTADKIYLVGFMSAGKSACARLLARRLEWGAEDVDELIELRERMEIASIFAQRGEAYFRQVEREVVRLLLPLRHVVVATGGGTFVDAENRTLINTDGVSVWLDAPFQDIVSRAPFDGRRPLATDRRSMEELFAFRRAAYQHAHLRVDASVSPVEAVVERVLERLGS